MTKKEVQLKEKGTPEYEELLKKVREVVATKVSPALQMHGGDLTIVDLEPGRGGYDLRVLMEGACDGCSAAGITLQYLVQETIDESFPDDHIDVIPVY